MKNNFQKKFKIKKKSKIMKIILGGNHELALKVLKWLVDKKEDLRLIISEGLDSNWETDFEKESKIIAEKFSIPYLVGDINSFSEQIERIEPDLIVLCRCKKRIKNKILSLPKIGCTNIHYVFYQNMEALHQYIGQ